MPKISVLMGIYNCARYLDEALESVQNQTFEDFEVIMCDDGSKDQTAEIAKVWEAKDGRFHLVMNDCNHGLAYTLNHCLEFVTGEYIVRMDGDDISVPDRFERLLKAANENPEFDVIGTGCDLFDEHGIWGEFITSGIPGKYEAFMQKTVSHASVIMKTSSLRAIGGYNTEADNARAEDYDLWCRMVEAGFKIMSIPDKLYQVRWDRINYYSRRPFKTKWAWAKLVGYWHRRMKLGARGMDKVILTYVKVFVPSSIKSLYHKVCFRK